MLTNNIFIAKLIITVIVLLSSVKALAQPPNNDCQNAIVLTMGQENCTPVPYAITDATSSGQTGCGISTWRDIWFEVTTTQNTINVVIGDMPGSFRIGVLDECGGGVVQCLFADPNSSIAFYVSQGTYKIRLSWPGNPIGDTELCVWESNTPCPPSGNLNFYSQVQLDHFAFPDCTEISGNVDIHGDVNDLSPLDNLISIRFLNIGSNAVLTEINGFQSLSNIFGVQIYNNTSLNDISVLQNVNIANMFYLNVTNNPSLSFCHHQNICAYLSQDPMVKQRTIYDNLGDCLDEIAVQTACSALPITLLSFIATSIDNDITLHWQTSSEIINHYFDIEYSIDGTDFSTIGRKEGAGNSNTKLDYHFVHQNVKSGIYYYRLKQVDYDGQYSYSDIMSVLVKVESSDVTIYPNPASDIININDADGLNYALYNLVGRQVKSGQLANDVISIVHLPTGMYYLHLDRDTRKSVYKIWKE